MLPTIVLFCLAPRQFIFGNVRYHMLDHLYLQSQHFKTGMTFFGKLSFIRDTMLREPAQPLGV